MTADQDRFAAAVAQWAGLAADLLERARRADLALQTRSIERRVGADVIRVLVAGDFKQGKSSLVNAITGGEPCSTAISVPTAVPTVCHFAAVGEAYVVERGEGEYRRRRVTDLEAQAAQEGSWPEALTVELGLPSAALESGFEFIDCPPASSRQASRAATVDAARSADIALMISDTTQSLTEPELALLTELCEVVSTILVGTKCDLVPGWRDVLAENVQTIERKSLPSRVVGVAAPLHRLQSGARASESEESGIDDLLEAATESSRASKRAALDQACAFLVSALSEARDAQARDLAVFGDRDGLRARVREAEADLERNEALRRPSAAWLRMLDARMAEISASLFEVGSRRLGAVVHAAKRTVGHIDPGKDWDTFEPWLRDAAGDVITTVITEAELRVAVLAQDLAEAFAHPSPGAVRGFSRSTSATDTVPVTLDPSSNGRVTRFVREGFATLGSTSGGVLAFATLGGVVSAAILAPLAAVIGAGLGGTAVLSDRRSERVALRQRAEEAIDRYGSAVADDLTDVLTSGFAEFKVRTTDAFISRADELVESARAELDACRRLLENSEQARERLAADARNIAEIDDLLSRIKRRTDRHEVVRRER
ncbi:MAG: GTPase domain-containing protein [Acidimicrobiia bacterium]|nr:GTPase domain-containing protein [Acidimicrobiia bacterium]